MKQRLIFIILLFVTHFSFCQNALIKLGKTWSVLHENTSVHIHPDDPYPFIKTKWYKIGKDTVFENKDYKQLLTCEDSLQINWEQNGLIREEERKVYYYNGNSETVLYDFNLNLYDTIILNNNENSLNYILDSLGNYNTGNNNLKIYYLSVFTHEHPEWKITDVWIEGIGSITGLLHQNCFFYTPCEDIYHLLCVYDNDYQLYSNPDFNSCFIENKTVSILLLNIKNETFLYQNTPNPFSSQTTIRYEIPESIQSAQLHICNMTGTLLKTVNVNQTGAGNVIINANEFTAGMYLYSLVCDGKIVETKQMILTK